MEQQGRTKKAAPAPPPSFSLDADSVLPIELQGEGARPPRKPFRPRQRGWGMPAFVTYTNISYLTLTLCVFLPALKASHTWEWHTVHWLAANLITVLTMISYYRAYFLDPGSVPSGWNVPENPATPFCQRCDEYKPSRTHHCATCRRCVLRYDHHCEWIDNCVGHANHKAFFLFILYITLMISHYWYLAITFFMQSSDDFRGRVAIRPFWGSLLPTIYCVIFSMLVFPLTFFAGCFLVSTSYMMLFNMTCYDAECGDEDFNAGLYHNISEVCGNWWTWFVPTRGDVSKYLRPRPVAPRPPATFV